LGYSEEAVVPTSGNDLREEAFHRPDIIPGEAEMQGSLSNVGCIITLLVWRGVAVEQEGGVAVWEFGEVNGASLIVSRKEEGIVFEREGIGVFIAFLGVRHERIQGDKVGGEMREGGVQWEEESEFSGGVSLGIGSEEKGGVTVVFRGSYIAEDVIIREGEALWEAREGEGEEGRIGEGIFLEEGRGEAFRVVTF
jgi:hypothetical protein